MADDVKTTPDVPTESKKAEPKIELKYSQVDLDNITEKVKKSAEEAWQKKLADEIAKKESELKLKEEALSLKEKEKIAVKLTKNSELTDKELQAFIKLAEESSDDKTPFEEAFKKISEKFLDKSQSTEGASFNHNITKKIDEVKERGEALLKSWGLSSKPRI